MNLARCACSPRSMIRFRACCTVHSPVGCKVTPRMRIRLVACSIRARTYAWVPSSRSAVKKSHAGIASAWERRNCGQVGTDRRGAGSIPAFLRISHTVEAAIFTPRPASSPWILQYPHAGFSRASRRTRALMFRRVAGRPVLPGMDLAAQRRRTMSRCQRRIVSGVTSSRSPWRRAIGYHAEQVASRARSAQFSFGRRGCRRCRTASWWRKIKISAVFHASSRRDSRSHETTCVIRRKTNRRHMTAIITAGRLAGQLCWSEPWTRFSARTARSGRIRSGSGGGRTERSLCHNRQCLSVEGVSHAYGAASSGSRRTEDGAMRAKVVVLGAGYAGLPAAKRLARQVHAEEVGVTLVNARAEFVERPRLHQLATGQPVAVPQLAAFLAGTAVKLQLGTVTGIDVDGNTVTVQTGRGAQVIGYDTLVYALGSNIDICAVPGVAEHAWSLTDREAAVRLGCRLGELAKVSGSVVVCGGGLTGIETAAELAES